MEDTKLALHKCVPIHTRVHKPTHTHTLMRVCFNTLSDIWLRRTYPKVYGNQHKGPPVKQQHTRK